MDIIEQFLAVTKDVGNVCISKQDFRGIENRGAPAIYVAPMKFMAGHSDIKSEEAFEGFYILQQGNDSILLSREQLEKIVAATKVFA